MDELLQELNWISITVRLLLALICGGILGIEREKKRRPAGLRTYMLVCVGAAFVMITNEYMSFKYEGVDPSRMGAQVISGIGFLGAGTIIVTGRNRVKGLTTAAGLWAAACIGLAAGAGFYSGAVIGCLLIFIVMSLLYRLDSRVTLNARDIRLYIEFKEIVDIGKFMRFAKEHGMYISEIDITKSRIGNDSGAAVLFTLYSKEKRTHTEVIELISQAEGINYIEEL